jgi:hypothetical protein
MHGTQKRPTRPTRAPAKNEPAITPRRHVAPRLTTVQLVERLVALQLRQAPLDILAAEALPPFLDMFDAPAGALLLYHCEEEALVLAAARGLSPAGTRHLARLQRGAAEAWEIPLHGLLNRKAYIIERPDEHPFVPELVSREEIPRLANLASIPLYRGAMPIGIVLAIADRRPISDTDILAHVLAFDMLALALDGAMPRRAQPAARVAASPATTADSAAALVCEPWVEPRDLARELEAELATVRGERETLAERLAATDTALAEATAALAAARTERTRAVASAEAALEQAVGGRDATITEARAQRDAAVAEARADRDGTVARLRAEHEAALELARGRHAAVLEEGRAEREAAVAAVHAEVQVAADAVVLGLRAEIAERNAGLAERAATLAERERALAATTAERDQAREAAAATSALVRQLRAEIAAVEAELSGARGDHEQERARVSTQADEVLTLRSELEQVRAEATQLAADRRRILAALEDPSAEPAAVIEALRAQVARLEAQVGALEMSRAELATRAETATDNAEHRVAMQRRAVDELRAEHAGALAAVRADAEQRLGEAERTHAEQLATAIAATERARSEDQAAQRRVVEELRASATELRASATAQVAAARAESEHRIGELRTSSERALADAHAGAERMLAEERTRFELEIAEQRTRLERALADERGGAERALTELRSQLADERARVGRDATELRTQYEDARAREQAETATLRARDVEALAAALATGDERAAEVDRLAGVLAAMTAEHDDLETRLQAALAAHEEVASTASARDHATTQRLAEAGAAVAAERLRVEREAAAARAGREREIAAERAAHQERLLAERVLFEQQGANARTRFEAELAAAVRTRDEHAARAAALAEEILQGGEALSAARRRQQALEDELAIVRAEAVRLRDDRERVLAAVEDPGAEPAAVIVTLRQAVASRAAEVASLTSERGELLRRVAIESEAAEQSRVTHERERAGAEERITAQRRELDDARQEIARGCDELEERGRESARLREELAEARAARAAAVAELGTVAGDRERVTAELDSVATERARALADAAATAAERERALTERERETVEREQALLDREIAAAARERALMDAERALGERGRVLGERERTHTERNGAGEQPAGDAPFKLDLFQPILREEREAARFDPVPAAPALTVDVLVPGAHRVLDTDVERRTQITAALANVRATPRRAVFANVLAPSPASMVEIESASAAGALVIGYAADGERSRIVGALRCFAAPPSGAEAAAALDPLARQPRRLISLSEDVDAFIPAKAALTAAGHSVAMACDAKQALDLLGMLTPDAVLVDARTAPEAAADFLAALDLEKGRVLVLLVHGPAAGGALAKVVQRLLRPGALDPAALARVYEAIIAAPAPTPAKGAPVKPVRAVERPKTVPRKIVSRRGVPQRR